MIKLIAIDLDGTLLKTDKTISQENLEAIHYAQEKGIKIVICTGRPYLAMKQFAEQIGFVDEGEYIIVFNGSQVRRAADGEVLVNYPISSDDLWRWYEATEALSLPLNPIDSEFVYEPLEYPTGFPSTYVTPVEIKQVDYKAFDEGHLFNKFVICTTEEHLNNQLPRIPEELTKDYYTVLSHPYQLEISYNGVSKGTALKALGEKLDISLNEMMAIGDENNDQTMIDMVGYGIAMGNAVEAIKESAIYVTDTNNHNGVAKAIYHYIK